MQILYYVCLIWIIYFFIYIISWDQQEHACLIIKLHARLLTSGAMPNWNLSGRIWRLQLMKGGTTLFWKRGWTGCRPSDTCGKWHDVKMNATGTIFAVLSDQRNQCGWKVPAGQYLIQTSVGLGWLLWINQWNNYQKKKLCNLNKRCAT